MKKIFSFCAAMLCTFALNAAVININNETPDALRLALGEAQSGDEIVMAAGTYVESNGNYIAVDGKNVTVMAADGAEVIIQPQVPVTLSNGGQVLFKNIKFDASRLTELADWYEHVFYPADANDGNELMLNGCEIYNFNLNKSVIYSSEANKFGVILIEDCYFHNIMKSCIFLQNTSATDIKISNSTFANIATVKDSYYAGNIDSRATSGVVSVDHCTFYDVQIMNTDYAAVGKIKTPNAVVSNCIFMLPESTDGIRAIRDVAAADNCLTFNYLKDSEWGIHSDVAKNNCIQKQDPLFVDAAKGDFHLGEGSPALGAGKDGSNLGDKRWWPAAAPEVEYFVAGSMNEWKANDAYKFSPNPNNDGEWMLNITLALDDELKVIGVKGDNTTWYPDGMGNNYKVDAEHAGATTIYFRPEGNVEGWYSGFFYVAPVDHTAISNTVVNAKAVKTFENGQLVIIKNGVKYNALGTEIR